MPVSWTRRSQWILGLAAVVLALIVVALPYAASTRIVRDRIAGEMTAWSGLRVSIGGGPEIDIWPRLRANLNDVSFWAPDTPGGEPVLHAERVEIDLSAVAALRGNAEFSTARLIRPTLRVAPSASGLPLPAMTESGRIAQSVEAARVIVAENPTVSGTAKLPSDAFGVVRFSDGRIVTASGDGEAELVTGLTGKVDWPTLNRQGKIVAAGLWRGEKFEIDVVAASPLLLFGGGATQFNVELKSAPANFLFDGTASLKENPYFDGTASLSVPSMRKMLDWSHADILHGSAIGAVGLQSHVTGDAQQIRFEDATITLDGNPGKGALDLLLTGKLPVLSGTLAFGTLDLRSFLSAFTPLDPSAGTGPGVIDPGFASSVNLDLRLSAARATVGSIALTDVAATARVDEGFAAFDISDAQAFGGNIQSGLRFDRKPDVTEVEMRLLASEIDGGAFGAASGSSRFMPVGHGTVSVILKGQGSTWDSLLQHAKGSVSASFGQGALSGFDIEHFLARTREGGFFAVQAESNDAFPIDALEFKASVADGVAKFETAEIRSPLYRIALSGTLAYTGGLALSGTVVPSGQATSGAPAPALTSFLVGGSWTAPLISPAATAQPPAE